MFRRVRGRHHVVAAYLALFVALGGTAIAAKPLITGADVQDGSLTGTDVQDGSLTGADVLGNSLTGTEIDESTLNLPAGLSGTTVRSTGSVTPTSTWQTIPGLSQSITPGANSTVYVSSDGGGAASSNGATVEIAVAVNGVPAVPIRRTSCDVTSDPYGCSWSIAFRAPPTDLVPGVSNDIRVVARLAPTTSGATSVGGSASSGTQGELTVLVSG
jgi:hypothetical protein